MVALLKLFRFLHGSEKKLTVSFIVLLASTGLQLIQPYMIEYAIDSGIDAGRFTVILQGAAGILAAALLAAGLNLLSSYLLIQSSQSMGYTMRNALYRKVMSFSFENLDRWRTGEIMVRLNSDVNTIRMFVRMGLFIIVQSVVLVAGTITAMYISDPELGGIMAVFMPLTLTLFFIAAFLIRPLFMKARTALDELNNTLQENLAGAKVVRAFARQARELAKFGLRNRNLYSIGLKVGYRLSLFFPLFFFFAQLATLIVTWAGGTTIITDFTSGTGSTLTLGQLVAFNNYAYMAMFPLLMLGMVLNFISMSMASAIRLDALFLETPKIVEKTDAVSLSHLEGKIEFINVSFRYGHGEKTLNRINLTIQPGEKLGIIGATGSGKSSLASLIPRFYDPEEGTVLVDGIDVRDLAFDTLRTRIAVVLQETVLFSGTIHDNIAYSAANTEKPQLERAADLACALEFIEEKSGGWNEFVGERGSGLSGGQRQRVAIARAIAADPDVIILDDVTSSLDLATEKSIIESLYREFSDRTAIIISQKIQTIRNADRIAVMEDGRIVAAGKHRELLNSSEIYRTIFETQNGSDRGSLKL